jgi:SAM-dependent methyltransferase
MALALTAQGLASPAFDRPYTYMELGCGPGLSLVLLAAANPHARFVGVDVMAEHVAAAQALAAAAGVDNLELVHLSVADLAARDWPACDVIALHGVWSWVAAPLRDAILRFIAARLAPGGLVYLSYNAMPGWAAMEPLRAAMKLAFDRAEGSLAQRIAAALAFVRAIEQAQPAFFTANPTASIRLGQMEGDSPAYLAHEYFNAAWTPFYAADMMAEMQSLGLAFAVSVNLADNLPDMTMCPEARALLAEAATPVQRETVKDFLVNKQFRRDLYVRDPRPLAAAELAAARAGARFAALIQPARLAAVRPGGSDDAPLNAPAHRALLAALQAGPRPVADLAAWAALDSDAAFAALYRLAAVEAVAPAASDALIAAAAPRVAALNAGLARRDLPARAVAEIGGGVAAEIRDGGAP